RGSEGFAVDAEAKVATDAVEHGRAHPVLVVEQVISLAQPDQHRRIKPVLCFRPIDADQQHAAAPLHQDISRLRWSGRSGRGRSRLCKRGAGSSKARGERGDPGTGHHEVSTRDASGWGVVGVGPTRSPGSKVTPSSYE